MCHVPTRMSKNLQNVWHTLKSIAVSPTFGGFTLQYEDGARSDISRAHPSPVHSNMWEACRERFGLSEWALYYTHEILPPPSAQRPDIGRATQTSVRELGLRDGSRFLRSSHGIVRARGTPFCLNPPRWRPTKLVDGYPITATPDSAGRSSCHVACGRFPDLDIRILVAHATLPDAVVFVYTSLLQPNP